MNLLEQLKNFKSSDLNFFGLSDTEFNFEMLKPSNVHDDGASPDAIITSDMRYPAPYSYPMGYTNQHGEIEMLGDVEATHWYAEAEGIIWHFVTTGNPDNEPFVIVHGLPESWYAFHHQMRDLSDQFYCIGVDVMGNGQSEKSVDLDYSYASMAKHLARFIDAIGLTTFNLAGHDRGTVIADHLLNVDEMNKRVLRYVRMQQSANEPHGDPVPPHHIFASPLSTIIAKSTMFPRLFYTKSSYTTIEIAPEVVSRLDYEFKYKGIAEALPLPFSTTSFDKELADRHDMLFAKMTMPMLFLQGQFDPGQHPEEYENTPNFVTNGRVQFIEAGHFFHLEAPEATTTAMREFLNESI